MVLIWKIQGVRGGEKQCKGGFWECPGFLNSTAFHELISLLKIL